jgi:hypothetical protein
MPASSSDEGLAAKFAVLLPHPDERQRRLVLGAEARGLGRGGIARVAAAAGVSRPTVSRGISEMLAGADGGAGAGRVRRPGGGRKPLTEADPGLLGALDRVGRAGHPRRSDVAAALDHRSRPGTWPTR